MAAQQSDVMADFRAAFRLPELTIAEADGWALSTRPGQLTLGSMVLSIRSGATSWAGVTESEGRGLAGWLAKAERLVAVLYGADKINAICLMMKDPIIHFHVIPRYSKDVERYGTVWTDVDWPKPPTFGGPDSDDALLTQITGELRTACHA